MDAHDLPDWCTPHEVIIRALVGSGGMGQAYADPVTVPAFVLDEIQLVRDTSGSEVVSSTTVHLSFSVSAPPGSLITIWPGLAEREATVITSGRAAHPTLPAYQTLRLT